MRIPRYWKKGTFNGVGPEGKPIAYEAWGWSDVSLEAALSHGKDRAYQAFRKHLDGSKSQEYEYLDTPLREEVRDSVSLGEKEIARVTRNHYGSLVLNAANVLFVDVDIQPASGMGILGLLLLAFFPSYREKKSREQEDRILGAIVDWSVKNPNKSFRLYKTKAGYRILFTDKLYDPQSGEVATIFDQFHSDRLYRILTRRQQCFRARLTPKAWRIGLKDPRHKYPEQWQTYSSVFEAWLKAYNAKIPNYSVCHLLRTFGSEQPALSEIRTIVDLHDEHSCRGNLPLA